MHEVDLLMRVNNFWKVQLLKNIYLFLFICPNHVFLSNSVTINSLYICDIFQNVFIFLNCVFNDALKGISFKLVDFFHFKNGLKLNLYELRMRFWLNENFCRKLEHPVSIICIIRTHYTCYILWEQAEVCSHCSAATTSVKVS